MHLIETPQSAQFRQKSSIPTRKTATFVYLQGDSVVLGDPHGMGRSYGFDAL